MNFKTSIAVALTSCGLFLFASTRASTSITQSPAMPSSAAAHPVVLELFTSEGCSSCPPADALLKKLDDAGSVGDVQVLALEEHVDYWDQQGWRDPFSSHDWTERQEQYSHELHDGVFTPQLVVNGTRELVAGSGQKALETIMQAAKTPAAKLNVSIAEVSPKSVRCTVVIDNAPPEARSADLWLAVTERGLSSNVLRGENQGRDLAHGPVLRALTRIRAPRADASGPLTTEATVRLDPSWKRENLSFVVFLQDKKSLHILGAAAASAPR
jgi:hypothetical protein